MECGKQGQGQYDRTTRRVRDLSSGNTRVYLEFEVRRVLCRCCGKVKRERLDFLADVVVMSAETFERQKTVTNTLAWRAAREGQVYEFAA